MWCVLRSKAAFIHRFHLISFWNTENWVHFWVSKLVIMMIHDKTMSIHIIMHCAWSTPVFLIWSTQYFKVVLHGYHRSFFRFRVKTINFIALYSGHICSMQRGSTVDPMHRASCSAACSFVLNCVMLRYFTLARLGARLRFQAEPELSH